MVDVTAVDHRAVVASLTAEQRGQLVARSDAAGLRRLSLHWGAIGVCGALIVLSTPLRPLVLLVHGVLITFTFTILHETVHRTPFRNRRLNDWVGRACGFAVFLGPHWFRHFHLSHHRYTNRVGQDPELASPRPSTAWQYVKYLSGVPDLIGRTGVLIRNATRRNQDSFVPDHDKADVRREAQVQLALYLSLLGLSVVVRSTILLSVWLLPLVLGGPFLRAYLLAEHAGCPHVAPIFENTRTMFSNWLVRGIAWNMPYHAEHHAFPAVPFHQLPEFHKYTAEHLQQTERGYWRFNRKYLAQTLMK